MTALTTTYYYWREGNQIVVQNMVGGYEGQKHKHTIEDFKRWKKDIDPKHLVDLDAIVKKKRT